MGRRGVGVGDSHELYWVFGLRHGFVHGLRIKRGFPCL